MSRSGAACLALSLLLLTGCAVALPAAHESDLEYRVFGTLRTPEAAYEGIHIAIGQQGSAYTQKVVTDAEGRWSYDLPAAGTYRAVLVEQSLRTHSHVYLADEEGGWEQTFTATEDEPEIELVFELSYRPPGPVPQWQAFDSQGFSYEVGLLELTRSIHHPWSGQDAPPGYAYIIFRTAIRHHHQDRQAPVPIGSFQLTVEGVQTQPDYSEGFMGAYQDWAEGRTHNLGDFATNVRWDSYAQGVGFPAETYASVTGATGAVVEDLDLAQVRIAFNLPPDLALFLPPPDAADG